MDLSTLRKLKKDSSQEVKKSFFRFVLVGNDPVTLSHFLMLNKKYEGQVKIICPREIEAEDLMLIGPTALRGEFSEELLKVLPEGLSEKLKRIESSNKRQSVFFKDMKFRKFGGRSKSETLLWGEEYYIRPGVEVSEADLYPELCEENALGSINKHRIDSILIGVRKTTRDNLIEDAHWSLSTSTGEVLQTEYLIWGKSPASFLDLYSHKSELSDHFIELCESVAPRTQLAIRLHLKDKFNFSELDELHKTLFIPLSYTHEWGHFIGEFKEFNDQVVLDFVTFFDKDHVTEEDISKKIKILKKNLKKIFPQFESISTEDYICLNENSGCLKIDDRKFAKILNEFNNLLMIGQNGLYKSIGSEHGRFEDSAVASSHLLRSSVLKVRFEQSLINNF